MIPPLSSAIRALNILQAFTNDRDELVRSDKRPASRILTPLTVEGFVEQNPRHAADEQGKNKRAQRPGS